MSHEKLTIREIKVTQFEVVDEIGDLIFDECGNSNVFDTREEAERAAQAYLLNNDQ